ncbi:heme-binding protein [Mycolicibacterium sp. P9-64]|uniref:SOUL family heme-binding protein n=1 Tax=Mycolicibacterium sp. P9-64 TaxID=2024612 RepID=UPI001F5BA56C|nr:heme-binding protein [Mycolicibacterium sp. P9-64]
MDVIGRIKGLAAELVKGGGSIVGIRNGTEEPRYTVEEQVGGIEIRRYGPRIAAQTTVSGRAESAARNAGFRRLAGYIFGANHANTKIAMTAPVTQQHGGGQSIAMTAPVSQTSGPDGAWIIRFFMPAQWTMDTLPEPTDPAVELVEVAPDTVAVLRFNGSRDPHAVALRTSELLEALESTAWTPAGTPVAWFYDPPWTIPVRRRNEVAVAVTTSR